MSHIHEPERFPIRKFNKLASADPVYQKLVAEAADRMNILLEQLDDPAKPDLLYLESLLNAIGARATVLGYAMGTTLTSGMNKIVGRHLGVGFKAIEVIERHEGKDCDEYRKVNKLVGTVMTKDLLAHFQQFPCVIWDDDDLKPDCDTSPES